MDSGQALPIIGTSAVRKVQAPATEGAQRGYDHPLRGSKLAVSAQHVVHKVGASGLRPFVAPLQLFRRHIAGKIIIPYLLLIFVLALLATHVTMNLISGSLEERFQEELAGAGLAANEAMVKLESGNLALIRQMAFTIGVPEAVAARDSHALEGLIAPIVSNTHGPYTDVFDAEGSHPLALRSPGLGGETQQRVDVNARAWAPVRAVFQGNRDALGDKYSDIVFAPWGTLLVTAGPVLLDGHLVGVVAIAYPLDDVVARLNTDGSARGLTLYSRDGRLLTP